MKKEPLSAVILAAGNSSRFYPFSNNHHKALTYLFGKKILEHTISSIVKTGVKNIVVVQGKDANLEKEVANAFEDVSITYVTQNNPTGMGNAILEAEEYLTQSFLVLSAHRLDVSDHAQNMMKTQKTNQDLVVLTKPEKNVSEYGVVSLNDGKITQIIEKPKQGTAPSNLRVLGIYLLTKEFLKHLKQSKDDHYSLESSISSFAKEKDVYPQVTENKLFSLKYPWDLFDLTQYMFKKHERYTTSDHATVAKNASITGDVFIGKGSKIMENASIKGPVYIGENVVVGNNTLIRNGSVIESDCVIGANAEINNSIIQRGTHVHSGFFGNSIIGENCRIGAQFTSGNKRLDRKAIFAVVNNKKVNTKREALGVFIGNNVKIGINCSTMPGVVIGPNSVIGPSTTVEKNVNQNILYYTKFKETIEKKHKEK